MKIQAAALLVCMYFASLLSVLVNRTAHMRGTLCIFTKEFNPFKQREACSVAQGWTPLGIMLEENALMFVLPGGQGA